MRNVYCVGVASALLLGLSACAGIKGDPPSPVTARAETARVAGEGDAADDPAVWVAADPAQSIILGTDKTEGLYAFGLDGAVRQFLPLGRFNNVDLRGGFTFGGREQVLVAATDRTNIALALFLLDPATGSVTPAPGGLIPLPDVVDPYGVCMTIASPEGASEDGFTVLVTGTEGEIRQFLVGEANGAIAATETRRGEMGSITEGCVFDDRSGEVFLAQEGVGVWRLAADAPVNAKTKLHPIDNAALVADVEGLSIYVQGEASDSYLIASSQGDSAYAVFALPEGRYVGRFAVVDGSVDGTSDTDGLDAMSRPLPGYPRGLLVIQDDEDDRGGQNFKLVDWADIATALGLD